MGPRDPRALIGAPFRLHGRDPETGLDCVGVVAWVMGTIDVPTGYRLRQADAGLLEDGLRATGLSAVPVAQPGDVLLIPVGPAQHHLGVMTDAGFVHACAVLRRVVETPGLPTAQFSAWRAPKNADV